MYVLSFSLKWEDKWFRGLSKESKILFTYLYERCDHAGFIEIDLEKFRFHTHLSNQEILLSFTEIDKSFVIRDEWGWLPNYLKHQGKRDLKPKSPSHKEIIKLINAQELRFGDVERFHDLVDNIKKYLRYIDTGGKEINIPFTWFWENYGKKVGDMGACERRWNKLTDDERSKIKATIHRFRKQFMDKQFQPFPSTYLNQKRFNDELPSEEKNITKKYDKRF